MFRLYRIFDLLLNKGAAGFYKPAERGGVMKIYINFYLLTMKT
jgi:hypothetical protein